MALAVFMREVKKTGTKIGKKLRRKKMFAKCNTWYPPIEVLETKKGYSIMMELPGSHRDDIKVWQEKGVLAITGEKKAPSEENVFGERAFGKFSRSFRLPEDADLEKIEANYSDGVIAVDIPKAEATKSKDIKIK
jgi:HSP20 family protein